ncbi:MAG TPA: glycoside hydrolase family 78 protein [Tepidisphaeraceae bacterium]
MALSVVSASAAPHVISLKCQSLNNPLGIDQPIPLLSWQIESDQRGQRETAYQILVASTPDKLKAGHADLWDTGKVASDQSIEVPYGGSKLTSGEAVYWKVRIWNKDGKASAWSKPAYWSMGLLNPSDWSAKWIGHDEAAPASASEQDESKGGGRRLPARYLRKEFTAAKPIRRAMVYFSGLGSSELYVNGKKIGNAVLSPALSDYTKRVYYVTYDVTDSLKKGENALGVILGNGRFYAPRSNYPTHTVSYGYPKLLLQLQIEYADGSANTIVSDPSWHLSTNGPILANNEYDGEEYDARREMTGWSEPDYKEFNWNSANLVDAPGGIMSAEMMDPIRVTGTIKPISMHEVHPGVFIYDLGQNMVGWCRVKATGAAGQTVSMRFAERLQPDGTLYVDNLRSARVTDRYTLKGNSTETWEPRFTYHGFRFVELTGFPGKPKLNSIEGRVVNDDVASAGDFACSKPILNSIYHNIVWGVRGNYRSMPTDCPQRDERQGWMGDRSAECRGETYIFQNRNLYAKWVNDMADAQHADGSVPDVCPAYWPLYNDDVVWPSTFVIAPNGMLDQFGDTRTIQQHYPQMVKWIDRMSTYITDNVMPRDQYGDWCVPPEDPKLIHSKDPARQTAKPILGTTYFYHCLQLMSRYATLLNHPEDAKRFDALAERLKNGLNKQFLNRNLGQYDNGAQTTSVLPLAFNMVPADAHQAVFNHLVDKITKGTDMHIGTGLVGGQWLNRVLTANGRPDIAYAIATQTTYPSWGYMVEHGATTVWELWNGDTGDPGMNSGNHVMLVGDLTIWFYESLAGIKPDPMHPGFKHIIMRPTPVGDLTWVKATHNGPYGQILSEWKHEGNKFLWHVIVPPNSSATLYFPTSDTQSIQEGGKQIKDVPDITIANGTLSSRALNIPAGDYHFESHF